MDTMALLLNADLIESARLLQRSLYKILLDSACPDAQVHAASIDQSQWTTKHLWDESNALPRCLLPDLSQAVDAAPRTHEDLDAVVRALSPLLPHVAWIKRQAQAGQDDTFVQRHRHGMITGPAGLFECPSLTLGLALMAPQTCYPFHQHPPAEFYLVLSPGEWYREDVGWWSPGAGGIVFNPPSCIHAMRSMNVPLLALWGLIH
jgi:hypothetical protein